VKNLNGIILKQSFDEIQSEWLDLVSICEYLMEFGIINSSRDLKQITGSFSNPGERIPTLIRVAERMGKDGIIALYAALYVTREDHERHQDAIAIFDRNGIKMILALLY